MSYYFLSFFFFFFCIPLTQTHQGHWKNPKTPTISVFSFHFLIPGSYFYWIWYNQFFPSGGSYYLDNEEESETRPQRHLNHIIYKYFLASFQACNFISKRDSNKCFPVKFANVKSICERSLLNFEPSFFYPILHLQRF